ncbi:uncharacterized protein C7orf57 isoform X1 [Nematostella vectensis]|uniref:uncharacterized protein C7orf57 isoform X1 n=1 Tax=Nematostella vectensis TaxID=45351 RepID=UPI00138FA939|nr:uncharacterized protein C7orf57 isoform X1 [Nematostella vectensis]
MAGKTKSGEWLQPVGPLKLTTTPRLSNILSQDPSDSPPVPDTPRSRIRDNDTDFVKIAKGGGHKDLLAITDHKPTATPKQYKKNGGDWYTTENNNNDLPQTPRSKVKQSDTAFLKTAKEGGHKDLLAIEEHKPTPRPVKVKKNGGDWYQHESLNSSPRPVQTPRSRAKQTDTGYIKTAKDGGHKDLLAIKEHKPSTAAVEVAKQTGKWFNDDTVDNKDTYKRENSTPASARVHRNYNRLQIKNGDTDFIKTAKRGGHSDLLKMPESPRNSTPVRYQRKCDWFYLEENKNTQPQRPRTASRSRTMESSVLSPRMEELARPRTAYRATNPIWVGGSGPEVRPSPARRRLTMDSGLPPYALHTA